MKSEKLPKKKLEILRRDVKGYHPEVAKQAKVTTQAVAAVLSGRFHSEKIVLACLRVRDMARRDRISSKERLKHLASQI